jgi:ubiquitin-protein ligase
MEQLRAKRLVGDLRLLRNDPVENVDVYVDENDMANFFFLIHGEKKSSYEGGQYIGRLLYPNDYPKRPPDYIMMTPSGRFQIGTKICLTNSGYHKNEWSPEWTISGVLRAFLSIFNSDDTTGLSHIALCSCKTEEEKKKIIKSRKELAKQSVTYNERHNTELYNNLLNNKLESKVETKKTKKNPDKEKNNSDEETSDKEENEEDTNDNEDDTNDNEDDNEEEEKPIKKSKKKPDKEKNDSDDDAEEKPKQKPSKKKVKEEPKKVKKEPKKVKKEPKKIKKTKKPKDDEDVVDI